jgi:hypothetical protein
MKKIIKKTHRNKLNNKNKLSASKRKDIQKTNKNILEVKGNSIKNKIARKMLIKKINEIKTKNI